MEWKKVSTCAGNSINGGGGSSSSNCNGGRGEGLMMVGSAMTEEQLETLRHQISIYASICEQLVEMHKKITAHQDTIAGIRLGSVYNDPLMMSGGVAKITARQRWSPTPMQLQILESIFDQGNGTPTKQKIKEIASDLSQHGQISETNVYNWFQNRRARSKRKQSVSAAANASSTESEAEAENECSKEVKGKLEKTDSFRSPGESSTIRSANAETTRTPDRAYGSNDSLKSLEDMDKMPFYETGMLNPRTNHLVGKFEMPEDLGSFRQGDSYNMFG